MIYVNWERVLKNPPRPAIRSILYSGNTQYLKGLYENGFTEYFTHDRPRMITRERAVEMFRGKVLLPTLDSFLINYPVPYFMFDITGVLVGNMLSFPFWFSEQDRKFTQSFVVVGREVVHERIMYTVLFNQYYPDPIQVPMLRYQFLAIPSVVFPKTQGDCLGFEESVLQTSQP